VGLLDYYRQFQGLSEQEVNARLREEAARRRERALARLEPLDLSRTTWPHLPHPYVVNAVTYVARRGLHRYPVDASELRAELAGRHGLGPEQVVAGHGAADLLRSAAQAVLEPGREVICPWPTYSLLGTLASRTGAQTVRVPEYSAAALLEAVTPNTGAIALASPNDPTGQLMGSQELRQLLEGLPPAVVVLLDQALVEFAEAEPLDAALSLLDAHPGLLVFRSFSKAWGLAGLRFGYAFGGPGARPLLERIAPDLGINELTQAGALEALRSGSGLTADRRAQVAAERAWLSAAVRKLGMSVAESEANFLWLSVAGGDGDELARRLARSGVTVAPGAPLGDSRGVRVSVQDRGASERLLGALGSALGEQG
jgi:histidinol-phosphate aminotransferase